MSGYRCVNYYELCRLCAASHGSKIHIFSDEGKKRNLFKKIIDALQITVDEKDKLPKIVCTQCLQNVETLAEFRDSCVKAQAMLLSCLSSAKLKNEGQVYIKDVPTKRSPAQPPQPVPVALIKSPIIKPIITGNSTTSSDFLSSIIQAVGIHANDESNETIIPDIQPQYTITLDGHTLKNSQFHYKIEEPSASSYITAEQQQSNVLSQVDEFLKVKSSAILNNSSTTISAMPKKVDPKAKKPNKINLVLSPTTNKVTPQKVQQQKIIQQQQQKTTTVTLPISGTNLQSPTTITPVKLPQVQLQDLKIVQGGNKCVVPIVLKNDGTTDSASQQILSQLCDNKNYPQVAYLQMKIQPNPDGQPIVHLSPAPMPTTISLTPQGLQQYNIQHIPQSQTQTTTTQQIQIQNIQQHHQPQQNLNMSNLITSSTPITILDSSGPITTYANSSIMKYNTESSQDQNQDLDDAIFLSDTSNSPSPPPTQTITPVTTTVTVTPKKPTVNAVKKTVSTPSSTVRTKPQITPEKQEKIIDINLQNAQSEMATQQLAAITSLSINKDQIKDENSPNSQNSSNSTNTSFTICEVCKKIFKRKEHLMQHLKSHIGLRPFKCDENGCNKSFSRKEHLMRHIVSHTGKKMFSCDLCHKLFSRKDNLNKHKRTHSDSSPSYQCDVCAKMFTIKVQFLKHKASHKTDVNSLGEISNKIEKTPTKSQQHPAKRIRLDKDEGQPTKTMATSTPQKLTIQKQQQHQVITSQAQQPQIMQVQLAMPNSNSQTITLNHHQSATSQQTTKATIIKTADGSTVYTIPSNLIINQSHFMTTGELMGNFKIENN